jgi:hypothetical protein
MRANALRRASGKGGWPVSSSYAMHPSGEIGSMVDVRIARYLLG